MSGQGWYGIPPVLPPGLEGLQGGTAAELSQQNLTWVPSPDGKLDATQRQLPNFVSPAFLEAIQQLPKQTLDQTDLKEKKTNQ